jgi:hypothetical protein
VVHHPQRGFGDAGRKLLELDAVELIDIDQRQDAGIEFELPLGLRARSTSISSSRNSR